MNVIIIICGVFIICALGYIIFYFLKIDDSPNENIETPKKILESFEEQLDNIDNAEDYTQIIETQRKKYTETLKNTIDSVYSTSTEVSGYLEKLHGDFDKYGVETMAKTYFDIISA